MAHRAAMNKVLNLSPTSPSAKMTGFSISRHRLSGTSQANKTLICRDVVPARKLELKCTREPPTGFCGFVQNGHPSEVVQFFRDVVHEVERRRGLMDFHMRIRDSDDSSHFCVDIFYGDAKVPPAVSTACISCDKCAVLYPGQKPIVTAGECILEEFPDPLAVCRLDAKARCGFVITLKRHVDRMSELHDEELYSLWALAVQTLTCTKLPFIKMILNHGDYRNVCHLHLKVWVPSEQFESYKMAWRDERKLLWMRLHELYNNRLRRKKIVGLSQLAYVNRRDAK